MPYDDHKVAAANKIAASSGEELIVFHNYQQDPPPINGVRSEPSHMIPVDRFFMTRASSFRSELALVKAESRAYGD